MTMLTLGIESSCDETSVAVVNEGREILSNVILSQTDHAKFGGVVPEVASRQHLRAIVPVFRRALRQAQVKLDQIELIAATVGPGLVGPLLVGLTFAKGLSFATGIPLVGVNHIEGHLAANILKHPDLDTHHLTLIASGGHTQLVEVNGFGRYNVLGQTKDDAAGEAFDKVAKLLGLGYPGGARLDELAGSGDTKFHRFPRALKSEENYQFSYSGLKTSVALFIKSLSADELELHRADIAASFQAAAVDVLVEKTIRAARDCHTRHVTISGGVAANSLLRSSLGARLRQENRTLYYPPIELCTDNGAMIAAAGYLQFIKDGASGLVINAVPYLKLGG